MQLDLSLVVGLLGVCLGLGSMLYARAQARATLTQANGAIAAVNWQGGLSATRLNELWRELMENPVIFEEMLEANPGIRPLYERLGARHALLLTEYFNLVHATWHLRKADLIPDYRWPSFANQARILGRARIMREVCQSRAERGTFTPDFVTAWQAMIDQRGALDPLKRTEQR
jgi:hypothetical protein